MIVFAPPPLPPAACHAPVTTGTQIALAGGVRLNVRTVGAGRPVLFIPSLARGAHDFDALAASLAAKGYLSILPDPRGIDGSTGPAPASLADLADDAAAAAAAICPGKVDVVGHAFGNRLARLMAARHPEQVSRVVLLAGGGEAAMRPEVRAAVAGSTAQGEKPDAERLKDIKLAFFADDHDPQVWLNGWTASAARAQQAAGAVTDIKTWWTGGQAPILLVQATDDPVAPPANAAILKRDIGQRLTVVMLPHASHAMLPEQPKAIADLVAAYLMGDTDAARLQTLTDAAARAPVAPIEAGNAS